MLAIDGHVANIYTPSLRGDQLHTRYTQPLRDAQLMRPDIRRAAWKSPDRDVGADHSIYNLAQCAVTTAIYDDIEPFLRGFPRQRGRMAAMQLLADHDIPPIGPKHWKHIGKINTTSPRSWVYDEAGAHIPLSCLTYLGQLCFSPQPPVG